MQTDRYDRFVAALRRHADLAAALQLLEWDQETFMPAGVAEERARQIGTVAALLHEQQTDRAFLDLVDELAARLPEFDAAAAVDVRETKWRSDRNRAVDAALVRERSTLRAAARNVWVGARSDDDFARLAPYLERIFAVERRVAAAIDPHRDPYDVLIEEYEPGMSTPVLDRLFAELRDGLVPLVARLQSRRAPRPVAAGALRGHFAVDRQRACNRRIAAAIGFDFTRGRLDEAAHPFSIGIGGDVRLTTRYDPSDLRYALFSTLHEAGHGLYEQGLDQAAWGTPRGTACSLGIHESQSRLWENQVGRSVGFWHCCLPILREAFPELDDTPLDAAVLAANEARPSLIRTESDEITYNLHIVLRFELERALLAGDLAVADLSAAWRERMSRYLGVAPATDREGVLQDVHWACGAIGYFPTYTLGNVYAAQLWNAAAAALGPLDALIAAGDFATLLGWLRTHVHRCGQTHRAPALIEVATGQPSTCRPLLEHLAGKVAFLEAA
ncbi:carboxypeptidase M32 [Candidatus Binatia bacterium]|nr:carboxypeptidase M32 [Candidatus Binatia bacterium]